MKLENALNSFKHIAEMYKAKYNKPPVIIYDNVECLIHDNPEILDILQDDAKDNAVNRNYIAVFVSSEASVLMRMRCKYWNLFLLVLLKYTYIMRFLFKHVVLGHVHQRWKLATLMRKNQWNI